MLFSSRCHPEWVNRLQNNRHRICLSSAVLFCTVFLAVCVKRGLVWEVNDDAVISYIFTFDDYSVLQWRLLSLALHKLYTLFPGTDWWVVCSVFALWAGSAASLYVIFHRYPFWYSVFFSGVFFSLLWFTGIQSINFTRTAVIVSMGGILLIADSVFSCKTKSIHFVPIIIGCILFLFGASIRENSAILALGYLAVIGFIRLISNSFSFSRKWFAANFHRIALLCAVAILFFAARGMNLSLLTPEQSAYRDYNNLRAYIQDYPYNYPAYTQIAEECTSMGISESAYDLFINWISEDTEVFSINKLERIVGFSENNTYYSSTVFSKLVENSLIPSVVMCVTVFSLFLFKKKNWIKNISVLLFSIFVSAVLSLSGRFPVRVYLCVLWLAFLSCAFLSGWDWKDENQSFFEHALISPVSIISRHSKLFSTILIAVCLICSLISIKHEYSNILYDRQNGISYVKQIERGQFRQVVEAVDKDPSHIYIFDIIANPAKIADAFNFGEPYPVSFCTNLFTLGGWDARHPYKVELLKDYGITNPMRALYERTDVYSAYSERILNYLRSDYDSTITCTQVGTLGSAPLVQYTALIPDSLITEYSGSPVVIDQLELKEDGLLSLCASTEADDRERIFYANMTLNGQRLTYRLSYSQGNLSGTFYDATLKPSELCIFEQIDGRYIQYDIVWS